MHRVHLPAELREQLRERRGGRDHVFAELDPRRTALLVVDMQNVFVALDAPGEVPVARAIVPNINRLAAALRRAGGRVVWIRSTFSATGRGAWPLFFESFVSAEQATAYRAAMAPGNPLHALYEQLDVAPDDPVVDKDRFSAFVEGASPIESVLRDVGVDTLLVTGTLTNICCESTARDAMMRDFRVVMVEDGNAARTDEDHLAGLRTFVQVFGDVRTTDELVARLEAGSEAGPGSVGR